MNQNYLSWLDKILPKEIYIDDLNLLILAKKVKKTEIKRSPRISFIKIKDKKFMKGWFPLLDLKYDFILRPVDEEDYIKIVQFLKRSERKIKIINDIFISEYL